MEKHNLDTTEKQTDSPSTESDNALTSAARTVGATLGKIAATVVGHTATAAPEAPKKTASSKTKKSSSASSSSSALADKRAASKKKKKTAHRRTLRRSNTGG
jgi:hypothetical protein